MATKWETVYTGTSIENFIICAFKNRRGRIIFDKNREKAHARKELHPTILFDMASEYAHLLCLILKGNGIKHHPLVIEGYLPEGSYSTAYMVRNLPVRKLWVPNEGVDLSKWQQRNPNYFHQISSLDLLSD